MQKCGVRKRDVVWCGVVWCGVVWCGVVWCGVVWCCVVYLCCVVLCGVVWCGVVWCGVVWCGVVWCICVVWCCVVWCGVGMGESGRWICTLHPNTFKLFIRGIFVRAAARANIDLFGAKMALSSFRVWCPVADELREGTSALDMHRRSVSNAATLLYPSACFHTIKGPDVWCESVLCCVWECFVASVVRECGVLCEV